MIAYDYKPGRARVGSRGVPPAGEASTSPLVAPKVAMPEADAGTSGRGSVLTDRQRVILDLFSEGLQTKQVARYMNVSTETVKWYLTRIRRKLDARNTTHAVAIYLRSKR